MNRQKPEKCGLIKIDPVRLLSLSVINWQFFSIAFQPKHPVRLDIRQTTGGLMMWSELIFCAGLIIWTASTLSRYTNILSEITGALAVTPLFGMDPSRS